MSKIRYSKEQNGHYYTRIAVPARLRNVIGSSQLQAALGSDKKTALAKHHGTVAAFQTRLDQAERQAQATTHINQPQPALRCDVREATPDEVQRMAHEHFEAILREYEERRAKLPTKADIEAAEQRFLDKLVNKEISGFPSQFDTINAEGEVELLRLAREHYKNHRERRLRYLREALGADDFDAVKDLL